MPGRSGVDLCPLRRSTRYIEPQLLLDRVVLHNALFPEAGLEIIGMGMDLDEGRDPCVLSLIVRQRFLRGTAPTDAEILQYMVSRGYVPDGKRPGKFYTPNRRIVVDDVHDENVIKLPSGLLVCFDNDIRFNTKEVSKVGPVDKLEKQRGA